MIIHKFKKGENHAVSDHFSSSEFDCHCSRKSCTETRISNDLIVALEHKRKAWVKPIRILSGFRCKQHNKSVGGATSSQHLQGRAADIVVEGKTPSEVADLCEDMPGLGRYSTFTHIDTRAKRSRWSG